MSGDEGRKGGWGRRLVTGALSALCWAYLAAVAAAWVISHRVGESWWGVTLLLFGPRYLWLAPLAVVLPAGLIVRGRTLWVAVVAAVVTVGPLMGFCVPWGRLRSEGSPAVRLRVLTCNVHGRALDAEGMRKLVERERPDVVALQDYRSPQSQAIFDGTWHTIRDGELLIASRQPVQRKGVYLRRPGDEASAAGYSTLTPKGVVYVINVHLTSPHRAFDAVLESAEDAAERVEANSEDRQARAMRVRGAALGLKGPVLLAGDFNLPPDSGWWRKAFGDFCDAYGEGGWGFGYSYQVARSQVRIDYVLGGPGWRCRKAWMGESVGSPHRPVIAEMEWVGEMK